MSKFLPLGSVVVLRGGTQPLMIVSWATGQVVDGKEYYFDYAGVMYPQGLVSDQLAFFQNSGIEKVLFTGYKTLESEQYDEAITNYMNQHPDEWVHGNPDELKKEEAEKAGEGDIN